MKFKTPIEVQAGISDGDPTNPLGQAGYLLSSDGSHVSWISPGGLSAETAETIVQTIKANEVLVKGDPVYIVGFNAGQNSNIVAKADSSDPTKMPAVGLADANYANQGFGTMTAFGSFNGSFDTTGGTENWAIGDIIFVKPGGGLTNIKPASLSLIQNVAIVSRVNQSTGELEVIALGRTNDVPNLPSGRLFVGTQANTSLASDVVYIDDTNNRVGIGTATPIYDLDVDGAIRASEGFIDNTFTSDDTVRIVSPDNATYTVASGGETGAIKIQAPNAVLGGTTGTSTKVSFKVNISDGVVIQISGTFSRPGVGIVDVWTALSVTTISNASTDNNYTITGDRGGSGAIWIGSSTDSQSGLKGIWVTDCQVSGGNGGLFGGSPQSSLWDISINGFVPTGLDAFLFNNTQVTNWKRNGQKLYYGSGTGSVGIGTTSPNELLHLSSTGPARLLIEADTDNVTETDNAQIILKQDGGAVVGNLGFKTNTNGLEMTSQYAGADGILTFGTRNTERMRVSDLGNVGIGTTSPGAKLDVDGNIIVSGGISNENDGVRVTNPGGASFITQTLQVAGAIKITLPQAGINTMMRMEVKVYEYLTNESFTVQCGGYPAGTSQWYNEYAYIESSAKDDRNFTVRFGYDGSKSCIYIGELGSTWSYPQVFVTEFQGGYLNATALKYQDGWDISFEASAFQGVVKTQANTQINNWARSGTNTYYASSTGSVGIGTTSPYTKLQVASASGSDVPTAGTATGGLFISNSNKTYGINMGVSGSGWGFIQSQRADANATLYNLNLQPLGGNVGIGTTNPGKLLELSGVSNVACLRLRDTGSNYWDIQNSTFGKLDFIRGGVFRMGISQNGGLSLVSSSALKGGGGSWGTYSDERVKKDVSNYTKGLNEILAIKPITYKYNGKANLTSEKQFVGIIAQEIKEVLPSTVEVTPAKLNNEDEFDTDLLTFDASELTFTLINAVKELKAEIEELKKQINKQT